MKGMWKLTNRQTGQVIYTGAEPPMDSPFNGWNSQLWRLDPPPAPADHIAESFWELDAAEMVAFFAHLDQIAGPKLGFQIAAMLSELADNPGPNTTAARVAFGTLADHATELAATILDIRANGAHREIYRMVKGAKA